MDLINISQCDYDFYNTKIHQPTLYELSEIFKEEEDLIFVLKLMTSSLKTVLNLKDEEITEFQIFLGLLFSNVESLGLSSEKKIKFLKLIQLCFKDHELELLKESFILKKKENPNEFIIIDNSNFEEFKDILGKMFDIPEIFGDKEQEYKPKNERAARIAKALEAGKKKVAELNNMKNKKGIVENYLTILSIGLKIPPEILCKHLTLYNLFNLYKRFTMKISWDLDIDCRLAGASPKDSPDNWMSLN